MTNSTNTRRQKKSTCWGRLRCGRCMSFVKTGAATCRKCGMSLGWPDKPAAPQPEPEPEPTPEPVLTFPAQLPDITYYLTRNEEVAVLNDVADRAYSNPKTTVSRTHVSDLAYLVGATFDSAIRRGLVRPSRTEAVPA